MGLFGRSKRSKWVFHRGALGDSVLLWPYLRESHRRLPVVLVTDDSKGKLAARVLGIEWRSAESRWCTELWREGGGDAPAPEGAELASEVVAFIDDANAAVWERNAKRIFPRAHVLCLTGRVDRVCGIDLAGIENPKRDDNFAPRWRAPGEPARLVVHVGAGSEDKRWPLERFLQVADRWWGAGGVTLVGGEVERERMSGAERAAFDAAGGRWIFDLDELLETIAPAAAFVGCDTGPTHLAAQLAVPTVAVFGPTDPERWAPIGPAVAVVRPSMHGTAGGAGPVRDVGVAAVIAALESVARPGAAAARPLG